MYVPSLRISLTTALPFVRPKPCGAHHTDTIGLKAPKRGFLTTGKEIIKRETPLGLYKGLGAVLTGIVPKMAIRFTSYEWYKQMLADKNGMVTGKSTFLGMHASSILGDSGFVSTQF